MDTTADTIEYIASGSFGDIFAVENDRGKHVLKFAWFDDSKDVNDSAHVEGQIQNMVAADTPHVYPIQHFDGTVADMRHCLQHVPERESLYFVQGYSDDTDVERYDRIIRKRKPDDIECELMMDRCERLQTMPIKIMKMPFADMKTLRHVVRRMPAEHLRRTLFQVLHVLHQAQLTVPGFRHNDLHLGNVLMTSAHSVLANETNAEESEESERTDYCTKYVVDDVQFALPMQSNDGVPIVADFGLSTSTKQTNTGVHKNKEWVNKPRSDVPCPQFDLFSVADDLRRELVEHMHARQPRSEVLQQVIHVLRACSPRCLRSGSSSCSRFSIRRQRQLQRKKATIVVSLDSQKMLYHELTPARVLLSDCFKTYRT